MSYPLNDGPKRGNIPKLVLSIFPNAGSQRLLVDDPVNSLYIIPYSSGFLNL